MAHVETTQQYGLGGGVAVTAARAGFWRRLGAFLVDYVVLYVGVSVLFLVPIFAITNASDAVLTGLSWASWLSLLIYPAYYIALEGGTKGQTLGKRALGIRVVGRETGTSIGHWAATGRFFARILSALPLYLGYLWMLWDAEKQTWHDKLSGSVVVPTSRRTDVAHQAEIAPGL
jgi:uncharacterized RDD family membrane protein YckC